MGEGEVRGKLDACTRMKALDILISLIFFSDRLKQRETDRQGKRDGTAHGFPLHVPAGGDPGGSNPTSLCIVMCALYRVGYCPTRHMSPLQCFCFFPELLGSGLRWWWWGWGKLNGN